MKAATIDSARPYSDAVVQEGIDYLMTRLPKGASITWAVRNAGRTVSVEVRLPGKEDDPGKRDTFEHGWVEYGGTFHHRSRLGRQGPDFNEAALDAIIEWASE